MLSIEFKKILKEGLLVFFFLIILMMGILSTERYNYLAPIIEIFLLLFASFSGWSILERERQDGALEYLLSMPMSRTKLLLLKLVPRVVVAALILLIYHLTFSKFQYGYLLDAVTFTLAFVSVFLLSLSFSISMKNFLCTYLVTLLLGGGVGAFLYVLDPGLKMWEYAIKAALSLLIVPAYFIYRFRKFDLKPLFHFNIRTLPILLLVPLVAFGITSLSMGNGWQLAYLTADGYAMSYQGSRTIVTDNNGGQQVYDEIIHPICEESGILFARVLKGFLVRSEFLVKIDLETGTMNHLYETKSGWWLHSGSNRPAKIEGRLYFLLTYKDHLKFKVLEVDDNKTRTIPVNYDAFKKTTKLGKETIHILNGLVANPMQFLVVNGDNQLFRIMSDGSVEHLLDTVKVNIWKNKILAFTKEGMELFELGGTLKSVTKTPGKVTKISPKFDHSNQEIVLIKREGQFYVYHMETDITEKIDLPGIPFWYDSDGAGGLRVVMVARDRITYYSFREGQVTQEKEWTSELAWKKLFYPYQSGMVVFNKERHEIFKFEERKGGVDQKQSTN